MLFSCFLAMLFVMQSCSRNESVTEISATEASLHIGQTITVVGTVVEVRQSLQSKGKPTHLNFEKPFPNQPFSVVIFEDARLFTPPPDASFTGKRVRVTGEIKAYKGKPEISVRRPTAIEIIGQQGDTRLEVEHLSAPQTGLGTLKLLCNDPHSFPKPSDKTGSAIGLPLVEQLRHARKSIDFAIYGIRKQPEVVDALKQASSRGVRVRGVVDNDTQGKNYYEDTASVISSLGNIKTDYLVDLETSAKLDDYDSVPFWLPPPEFKGPVQCVGYSLPDNRAIIAAHASREPIEFQGDIMHNKFFVVDGQTVWTGSCNISNSGTGGYNANVGVLIESQAVASWYTAEFEQMYLDGHFHRQKEKLKRGSELSTHLADGTEISAYFSPQGYAVQRAVQPVLQSAQKTIDIAIFFLTHKYLTADLIHAHQRGVTVRVIIDATGAKNEYTKHEILRAAGIKVKVENWGGKMHAKAVVVDGKTVVLGSMNWTSAGERSNDENTIKIQSPRVAAEFGSYFEMLWEGIDDAWLHRNPDPESRDSGTSWCDGIDNDFDGLIDDSDPGTSANPPPLPTLPPYRIVKKGEGNQLIKGAIIGGRRLYFLPNNVNYEQIQIDTAKDERWFPSVWEATESGWKPAK